jgi:Carbohydrate binding domain
MNKGFVSVAVAAAAALTGLAAPQAANAFPTTTPSWGAANLISYADGDFEGGIGNWVSVSNATLSGDAATAFLHAHSLRATASTAGSQAFKLGANAGQINVTGGDRYRVSAWFKAPAASGRTVTWAMGLFTAAGTWIGWTSAAADTLNSSGGWQYASAVITAPSNAGFAYGSPKVTEGGVSAGEALHMDEVLVEPYRSATLIGAEDTSGDGTAFAGTNATIGPMQSDKIFYGPSTPLPSAYAGSNCANLPARVTCLISFKVMNTNVASYVSSIPPNRNVIFTFWQEPEKYSFSYNGLTGGPAFVAEFENQAALIRQASGNAPNIFIAGDANGYQYDPGTSHNLGGAGGSCSFTVPSSSVDFYLGDFYEPTASGTNLATDSYVSPMWNGWLGCVSPQKKPIGVAEYGLNFTTPTSANGPTTAEAFAADNSYLESQPAGRPVVMWEYWYDNNANGYFEFTDSASISAWRANETANGGGAN